jgi:exopolysaccharide biosynthesis operon protein EpsL
MARRLAYPAMLGWVFLAMSQPATATATIDDTFTPYVGASIFYDSNLLRLSNSVTPQEVAGKSSTSDLIKQVSAGLNMDWAISRQHAIVKVNFNQNWFSNFTSLDYVGHDILTEWKWQAGSKVNGEIGYSNKATLGSFAQLNRLINNIYTTENYFVNGDYQIIPDWSLRGDLRRMNFTYSAADRQTGNLSEDRGEIGLRHLNQNNTLLGVRMAIASGSYPDRTYTVGDTVDNIYTRYNYNLDWEWHYSVKTKIDGYLGYTQQTYGHLTVLDFSGITGNGNLTWYTTEKTNLLLNGWRKISQSYTLTSTFMLSEGLALTPSRIASAKVKLSMPLSYEQQNYLGNNGTTTASPLAEVDKVTKAGLILSYKPLDNTELSFLVQYEGRSSNNLLRNYQDQSAGMNMQVAF